MRGLLLDRETGLPNTGYPWMECPKISDNETPEQFLKRANREAIRDRLRHGIPVARGGSKQGFNEVLVTDLADGAQILNTTTETIICPDYSFAANDPHVYPGATFRVHCEFDVSNVVTTPGTLTMRVRWGGVGGTILATTGAITLSSTARANFTGSLEVYLVVRTVGSAGSMYCMGKVLLNDVPAGADSAPQSIYTMTSAGLNVPAVVSSLDTTTAKLLSVTGQFSVSTATTQLTNHIRVLECLN
jgi:hypothetical protein